MYQLVCLFTICLILTVDKLAVVSATYYGGTAELDLHFKDRLLNHHTKKEHAGVRSAIECASICMRTSDCMSFFYNEGYLKCSLHPIVFTNASEATVEFGSMYYYMLDADNSAAPLSGNTLRSVCEWHSDFFYFEGYYDVELCLRHSLGLKLSFENATTNCSQSGARLLRLETQEKIQFIVDFLNYFNIGSVWIGATLVDNEWVWDYNMTNPVTNFTWGVTDDDVQQPDGDGNCIRLSKTYNYTWADTKCSREKLFMCEITITN